ncbi:hypothetical protein R5R35_007957 [Gryllus longicercus]|uniref:Uncharacterized protein n=1 Tax=Gryllus longicercus TaxID=2509291 RepID=A0AAN9Z0J4_9ORTH
MLTPDVSTREDGIVGSAPYRVKNCTSDRLANVLEVVYNIQLFRVSAAWVTESPRIHHTPEVFSCGTEDS